MPKNQQHYALKIVIFVAVNRWENNNNGRNFSAKSYGDHFP
ncbi:hypothetical protein BA6E_121446 [Bacteroidales bacterium 6E]|nr:hypothetical protein BA6E_121446 [Bacteroidales bacterium 6E]